MFRRHRAYTATAAATAAILTLVIATPAIASPATPASQKQQDAGVIASFPVAPSPSGTFDWRLRARDFDSFVYDWTDRGDYTTISTDATAFNLPAGSTTYKMPAYYGDTRVQGAAGDGKQEAVAQIASVVGATLVGIDKSDQGGRDYVDMLRTFYHPDLGVAKDTPSAAADAPGSQSIWYTTISNVLYYMLGDQYPDAADMTAMLRSIANKYYAMVTSVGGASADFTMQDFDFATGRKVTGRNEGGEAAVGAAAILLWAHAKFGDAKYLQGAKWAMDALERSQSNLYYEVIPLLAPYLAARLNAEDGTDYDISKYLSWLMQDSDVRGGWGTISGTWGDKDVSGLTGSRTDKGGYAFAMNSFATPLLAATAKYDSRYANTIGRWMLNVENASRFFYADQMPASEQYYGSRYIDDPARVIAYEGIMKTGAAGIQARGDIPERSGGWGVGPSATSLGIYGSSWVGFLAGAVSATTVPNVLRTDLNALDFFGDNSYATSLYYNPNASAAAVSIDLAGAHDLYDAVSDRVIAHDVSGRTTVNVPAGSSLVLVEIPAGGKLAVSGSTTTVDGHAVGYDRSPGRDLAAGGIAAASSTASGSSASAAVDGSTSTAWTAGADATPSLTVDLRDTHEIGRVVLDWGADHADAFRLDVSTDGSTWTEAAEVSDGRGGVETVTFAPANARYLRVSLLHPHAATRAMTLHELNVFAADLAAGTDTTVSSTANTLHIAANLTDGSPATRWESKTSDPQSATVDLGAHRAIGSVRLSWEAAAAKSYRIQLSDDGTDWSTAYSTTTGAGGVETVALPADSTARYVRLDGTERLTRYAYSIFSLQVFAPAADVSAAAVYALTTAQAGAPFAVSGRGFAAGERVELSWSPTGDGEGDASGARDGSTVMADGHGGFDTTVTAPHLAGAFRLTATGHGSAQSASTAVQVDAVAQGAPRLTLSTASVNAGDRLSLIGTGFGPQAPLTVWLHSTPVQLTTVRADASGGFTATVRIPTATAPGSHAIVVESGGTPAATAALTVTAASTAMPNPRASGGGTANQDGNGGLAATGSEVGGIALAALLLLALGATAMMLRRRSARP